MNKASEALFTLKPVCFRYKKEIDPVGISQLDLMAEEVEKVNPDLAVRDTEGKPYTVRYDQVNAMLLNEFLKEHRKVRELETTPPCRLDQTLVGTPVADAHRPYTSCRRPLRSYELAPSFGASLLWFDTLGLLK
jgi:hypothetical protein